MGKFTKSIKHIYEATQYSKEYDDGYRITTVEKDKDHRYTVIQGIEYELSSRDDRIVPISSVFTTEGNVFYEEQIDKYVEYIENGGILETLPVSEIAPDTLDMDGMVEELENSAHDENWKISHYWGFMDKFTEGSYEKLDEYIEAYWEDADDEKLTDFKDALKEWFENWGDNNDETEYHLTDSNHRFEALKRIGVTEVMVEVM